eukprot:CAMPEP_0170797096 /NCGR_PEP_ID=MMETSP0733-20121128/25348_1 /TAXON_ID=186038 /ORGANISM="Fragilariopsis kerguelensis, Strain L26-C5" /LENGTH=46 /DNA_ID= /DNA_START= /DNA_END= /DNA_ORIENTATION=
MRMMMMMIYCSRSPLAAAAAVDTVDAAADAIDASMGRNNHKCIRHQ